MLTGSFQRTSKKSKTKGSAENAQAERKQFEMEELEQIFDPTLYKSRKLPHSFWPPLIALMTGARVNEIAQLYLADIVDDDRGNPGRWRFMILAKEVDQRVKNPSSLRSIPMHPKLIEMGFLTYLEDVKSLGYKRVFPTLRYTEASGYGDSVSEFFLGYPFNADDVVENPSVEIDRPLVGGELVDATVYAHKVHGKWIARIVWITTDDPQGIAKLPGRTLDTFPTQVTAVDAAFKTFFMQLEKAIGAKLLDAAWVAEIANLRTWAAVACYARHVQWLSLDTLQDEVGRAWDVLMLSALALRLNANELGQAATEIDSVPPGERTAKRDDLPVALLGDERDDAVVLIMLATETVRGINTIAKAASSNSQSEK